MARYLDVHPDNPQPRAITQAVAILRAGGLIVYPTDSAYALGAMIGNQQARARILRLRHLDDKHDFTMVCANFAQLGQYVKVDNSVFRAVRAATPGPYTFILPATAEVPRRLQHRRKKTIGVRIPDHSVCRALLAELGEPILSSTLILPGEQETPLHGWDIKELLDNEVDAVIDAGDIITEPTTVVDFSAGYPQIRRDGAGDATLFE